MIERPTSGWREQVEEQAEELAAGLITDDDAYAAELWPEDFCAAVDVALDGFDVDVRAFDAPTDEQVLAAVERVVLALNGVDAIHHHIETGEREELCAYIDDVLEDAGVDVAALAARRGVGRFSLTNPWRRW
jgi:hypothetical protein